MPHFKGEEARNKRCPSLFLLSLVPSFLSLLRLKVSELLKFGLCLCKGIGLKYLSFGSEHKRLQHTCSVTPWQQDGCCSFRHHAFVQGRMDGERLLGRFLLISAFCKNKHSQESLSRLALIFHWPDLNHRVTASCKERRQIIKGNRVWLRPMPLDPFPS